MVWRELQLESIFAKLKIRNGHDTCVANQDLHLAVGSCEDCLGSLPDILPGRVVHLHYCVSTGCNDIALKPLRHELYRGE